MDVLSMISTKGGAGKTTVAANLGGVLADAGLRVLLLDLDSQPTLSSYYALRESQEAGSYELIAQRLTARRCSTYSAWLYEALTLSGSACESCASIQTFG